jgi:hypothetical protein
MTDLSIHLDPADIDADAYAEYVGRQLAVARRRIRAGRAPELSETEALRRVERECEKRRHQFRRDNEAA